ncbi:MAG: hypothetical protein ABW321_17615 [Polyangiales bacterium]
MKRSFRSITGDTRLSQSVSFVLRSARSHPALALGVGFITSVFGVLVVSAEPAVYESTSKLFVTQHAPLTSELASGHWSAPPDALDSLRSDRPDRFLSRDELHSLARAASLVERDNATRSWLLRLGDKLDGIDSPAARERAVLAQLTRSLSVKPEPSGAIRFRARWSDPVSAHALVSLAQRDFLRGRERDELTWIQQAADALETESVRADVRVEALAHELEVVAASARPPTPVSRRAAPIAPIAGTRRNSEITGQLVENRQAQRQLIEPWQRRSADLRYQVAELRATHGRTHPTVLQHELQLQAALEEPSALTDLRARERELVTSLLRGPARAQVEPPVAEAAKPQRKHARRRKPARVARTARAVDAAPPTAQLAESPGVAAVRRDLEAALREADTLRTRADSLRLERAAVQAGFKYRYSVLEAAVRPAKPIGPQRLLGYALTFEVALALGLLAAMTREWLRTRIVARWQVRRLGVAPLAELDLRTWRIRRH